MKRWSKEFVDPHLTKMLFISLVRPIPEYGYIIWDPCCAVHIIFCLRSLDWNFYKLPQYRSRAALIKLPILKSRRSMMSILFNLGLIREDIDSEFLLSRLKLNVPIRNFELLSLNYYR